MDQKKIGAFIAQMRKDKDYTQLKLAEQLGISVNELLLGEQLNVIELMEHKNDKFLLCKKASISLLLRMGSLIWRKAQIFNLSVVTTYYLEFTLLYIYWNTKENSDYSL